MSRIGFYSGSFDPVTLGHIDVITRAAFLFDQLVIGVGVHHGKAPFFSDNERVAMLEAEIQPITEKTGTGIFVVTFDNLVVDAARDAKAQAIVRGLRDTSDFDYEMQMAGMNGAMMPEIETIFLAAKPEVRHIAAKFVRQIATMGGDVTPFVSPRVAEKLRAKFPAKS